MPSVALQISNKLGGLNKLVVLANDTLPQDLAGNFNTQLTVTNNRTITTTVLPAGSRASIIVLTSGTNSYNITFGTGFKTTGVLATGTVSAKTFVVSFVSDGTTMIEVSRTAAM